MAAVVASCGSAASTAAAKDGGGGDDAGVVRDGGGADGAMGIPDADGGSPGASGCAAYPGAVFCDDFETAGSFAANWPATTGVAPVVTTSPTAYSPTHVASAIGGASDHSLMQHALPAILATQTLRIAFSLRVEQLPSAYALVADVSVSASGDLGMNVLLSVEQGELTVELLNDASQFPGPDAGPTTVPLATVTNGSWVRVELDVDVSDQGSVKALVDGSMKAELPYVPGQSGFTGTYQGDLQLEAGESTSIDFDDAVIWQP
jgi:hypothetical protein